MGTGASSCTLIPLKTTWLGELPNLYTQTHTRTHTHTHTSHLPIHTQTHTHNTQTHNTHKNTHTSTISCRSTTPPPTPTHRPSRPIKAPSFSLCPHSPLSLPLGWWNECYRAARAAQLTAAHVTTYYKPQSSNNCVPYNFNTSRPT